ncbi:hypothetical protein Q5P01_007431 [Channa striata]|uniref:Uncharacterized protein n=1 Tax=Channa striata TaxID=64152 RepID=A0AA88SUU8_CHASR|nr:hypothetical protein Q5P01_007431 [Channa striata]
MSRGRLPAIGSSESKTALQRSHQPSGGKRNQQQTPSSLLLSDTTMTPWGGLALSASSFDSIPRRTPTRPHPASPPPPPAPQPTPSNCYRGSQGDEDEAASSSSFNLNEIRSPPLPALRDRAAGRAREMRARRRVLPQRRVPHFPRLPPLHPVTNLSFSRSFTFSFFELPLHQSPHCRAERIRNLMLLLRQIHF